MHVCPPPIIQCWQALQHPPSTGGVQKFRVTIPVDHIHSEKVFVSQERVSGFPEVFGLTSRKSGNFRGSLGNFRGSLGNFRCTSGLLLSSTVRELPGKSPRKLPGMFGELPGKSGDFPEAQGSPPSDSPNLSPIHDIHRTTLTELNCLTHYYYRFDL